jgi:hypothetical protein
MGVLSHGPRSLPPFRFCQAPWKSEALANESNPDFLIGATISDRAMSGLSRACVSPDRLSPRNGTQKASKGERSPIIRKRSGAWRLCNSAAP